ncbi:MAG: F0F1 ATP synthase subunit gamma [Candidatus Babeliales bacterium]
MSVLMLMRQRMKAVETIQKITHAMRLISMSSHTRLRNKKTALTQYAQELSTLFAQVYAHAPSWHHPILLPKPQSEEPTPPRSLIILVGSQKGLCGTFNQSLFAFFERSQSKAPQDHSDLIVIGKRAGDYARELHRYTIVKEFNNFTHTTFTDIAAQVTWHIMHSEPFYTSVTVYSNWSKSFFVQVPESSTLIPLALPQAASLEHDAHEGFEWEQTPERLLSALAQSLLLANLQDILLTSLTAEQAARFVAMDNSTRNARNLLDDMTLDYNKRRQAKITRELTDLIGSL